MGAKATELAGGRYRVPSVDPLVMVSNRGPLSFQLNDAGELVPTGPAGGLAATLQPLLEGSGSTWISSSMSEADRLATERGLMQGDGLRLLTVQLSPDVYRAAYDIVSNATLWFCFHHLFDLPRRPRFDARWHEAWEGYRELNREFTEVVTTHAPEGAAVLVQDYHLLLTGTMLGKQRPDLRTVHFLHTPFCGPDMLRVLPSDVGGELLRSMASFGACGFHARRWQAAFLQCWSDPELSASADALAPPRSFVAAIGPVPQALTDTAGAPETRKARAALRDLVGDRSLVVRVDRIELSKNILRGCWALDDLLRTHPEWRGRVVLLALAYPSREGLAEYLAYRSELEHTVARINEAWATSDWAPIVLDVADDRYRSMAALCEYDVLLVNPLRDGMNLVAKEGPLVNEKDGVLVLSREAGAWEELRSAALGINPFDVSATSTALDAALRMDRAERRQRAGTLKEIVLRRDAHGWLADLVAAAEVIDPSPSA